MCVGGGGALRHIHLTKCIWIYGYLRNSHLCQFTEIVHKIINWYMKDAK